jgi:protein-tyrosine phosphatase
LPLKHVQNDAVSLRPLALPAGLPGRVFLSGMPGRFEAWPSFLARAGQAGVTHVVCLTPLHEIESVSPDYHDALERDCFPYGWEHLPMRDFGAALEAQAFHAGIEQLAQRVLRGETVLLHCAAGIGRTGTVAACLLKRLGMPATQALQRVREAGSNPQSAVQSGLIDSF